MRSLSLYATLLVFSICLGASARGEMAEPQKHALKPSFDAHSGTAYRSRALTLMNHGNLPEARRAFENAVALAPGDAVSQMYLGLISALQSEDKDAIRHFNEALTIRPNLTMARLMRGLAQVRLTAFGKAREDFDHIIRENPRHFEAYAGRAMANLELGNRAQALDDANFAVQGGLVTSDTLTTRARAHLANGNALEADNDFRQAKRLDGDQPVNRKPPFSLTAQTSQ